MNRWKLQLTVYAESRVKKKKNQIRYRQRERKKRARLNVQHATGQHHEKRAFIDIMQIQYFFVFLSLAIKDKAVPESARSSCVLCEIYTAIKHDKFLFFRKILAKTSCCWSLSYFSLLVVALIFCSFSQKIQKGG